MNWMSLKRIERIKSRSWPIMCVSGDKQMRGWENYCIRSERSHSILLLDRIQFAFVIRVLASATPSRPIPRVCLP